MIPYSVVLVLVVGAHLVDFTDGQFNSDYFSGGGFPNVDWNSVLDIKANLQDGYLDYYDCTLKCFADVFQLSYIKGDFCNRTFQLYSQDWSPVPFQKVGQVIECITVKCPTVIHKSVCDLSYDYPNDQYAPGSSAFKYPNYQYPAAGDQLNSLISGTNPPAAAQNVPVSDADQLSQLGPQKVFRKKPNPGSKPKKSSNSPFSTPFPLSDIMKQHLTKYGYKIPKSRSTPDDSNVATDTVTDDPTTDTTSTTDSTLSTTTESTSTTETTSTTTESTTPTTPSTTPSTTPLTTASTTSSTTKSTTASTTESTTATPASSTESTATPQGSKTDAVDLLSEATDVSWDNLNYPSNPAGYNLNNLRSPYYDYNGYPLGGSPGNYPYNSDNNNYYYYDYPYNDNYQQFPYNYRNPSYNPNLYTSKQVNIPGYQNQATGAQVGNLGYQPALNYNSNSQSQNILSPFSANWLKNSQTPITQDIQGPGTNNNLGNVQGVNQTPIYQGAPGSSSFALANSESQINQAPSNTGVPNSKSISFATSGSQANQVPSNSVPGLGSFALANSASQKSKNLGVPDSNSFSFANGVSQTVNQAPNNLEGAPGLNLYNFANSASQINGARNNFGVPDSNSFSSENAASQANQAPINLGGLNSYNFANSGSGVNTALDKFGVFGPNSYVNQAFENQPLNNQGLQGYQVPTYSFNQQNIPQNGNSLSDTTFQSSSLGANPNPANSEQNSKNLQNPTDNLFKIEYNDETYVLEKDGSISVYKNNVFVRKLKPFK